VPVSAVLDIDAGLPAQVEAAVYYVIAEALTNVTKYAAATAADVAVSSDASGVRVAVADDGVGGADPAGGSGLRGLADRVEALGGRLAVRSPATGGTRVEAWIPVEAPVEPPAPALDAPVGRRLGGPA
jgi:signal transduction histidine kinase